jgi:hypothetical protein
MLKIIEIMSIFDTLPMFDHTLDDQVLEIGILAERYEDDLESIDLESPSVVLEYGWSEYEEGEGVTLGINVAELWIRRISTGYSVYEAEYSSDELEEFDTFEELYASILTELSEYFE